MKIIVIGGTGLIRAKTVAIPNSLASCTIGVA
jgi:hypothetical protein